MTISGSVSDDVKFIYKKFPVQSSMRAIIEVDVYYPDSNPILGIYTTRDHVNIKQKCVIKRYGQLENKNMHPGITMLGSDLSRTLNCDTDNMLHCTGNITIQDFKPRNFSFSFGFQCFNCFSCSLKGLAYNLKIYGQTNETHCMALSRRIVDFCYRYTSYGVFPNLLGVEIVDMGTWNASTGCYELAIPFNCYMLIPKCDPISKRIIPPCREMCHDYLNACNHIFRHTYNCDYLPTRDGNIPCIYYLTTCTAPPVVKNAEVVSTNDTAQYSCSEGFTLIGNKTIT